MKFIKKMLVSLVCTIAFIGIVIIGGYVFIRSKYGIDLFLTVGQLKTLSQSINESTLCPNAFGLEDFDGLKNGLNDDLKCDFIGFEENSGYLGYSIDFSALSEVSAETLSTISDIKMTEKQVGALAEIIFFTQTNGKIDVNGSKLNTSIVQVDFSNISDTGSSDFNVVVKIDLTSLTENLSSFPFNLIKKYIPKELYVLSTVRIDKTEESMGYSVSHKELCVNNLSSADTEDLFHTLDTVLKIGSAKDFNTTIGTIATDVLIGNEENNGFAYSLKQLGKNDFNFKTIDTLDYFIVS